MDLVIDAGNTNIVFAIYDNTYTVIDRVVTARDLPELFFTTYYTDLLIENGITAESINNITISSVVSEITDVLKSSTVNYFGIYPTIIEGKIHKALPMPVPKPYEIGSDLVANAYAVYTQYKNDHIIIDFGTALTFTVVSAKKGIEGVTIAPGIKTAISALSGQTSKLPEVPLKLPTSVVGKNTTHAIQAGVLYGYIGLVKEVITRIKSEKGEHFQVIATGGLSGLLPPLQKHFDKLDRNLTLDGIRTIGLFWNNR